MDSAFSAWIILIISQVHQYLLVVESGTNFEHLQHKRIFDQVSYQELGVPTKNWVSLPSTNIIEDFDGSGKRKVYKFDIQP